MSSIKPTYLLAVTAIFAVAGCTAADETVVVVGELTSDRIELSAEFAEPIVEVTVSEGEAVVAGQVLVRQDDRRATARVAEATAQLGQAEARLDELVRGPRSEQISAARANVDGAEQDLEFRRVEFERAQQVHERKLASPETLDRARAALDAAEANLKLRRAQLQELLAGTTVEELAQAEHAVEVARARLDGVRVDLERLVLRAPVDGVFDSRLFEPGERPAPGQPVAIMLSGAQPYARVYIPERLVANVSQGANVAVHVDGLDAPLDGRVRWVSAEAAFTPYFALTERDRGRLSFVAKIDVDLSGRRLPDGVPVNVDFGAGDRQ